MSNKLEGLPPIFYLNLDEDVQRKNLLEEQFEKYKIKNFKRFSASKYTPENFEEWKDLVHYSDITRTEDYTKICVSMSTLEKVRWWLENTNEKYLILFEDDYDINLIDYWHFDWKYLMNTIPYDWDCIQLGFETHTCIHFFLHPKTVYSFYGPVLINRYFGEKLLRLHCINGKYLFHRKYGLRSNGINWRVIGMDDFFASCGRTYEIPLITQNCSLDIKPKPHHFACRELYYDWWENERDKFTLEEFFTYGKINDFKMTWSVDVEKYKDVGKT
jgi:hypothetical protein